MLIRKVVQGHAAVCHDISYPKGPLLAGLSRHYLGSECDLHFGASPNVSRISIFIGMILFR